MAFPESTVQAVWEKGQPVPGYDPSVRRKDTCGGSMNRSEHGNRHTKFGWEIDHVNPHGGDGLSNLQPLQWENNAAKSDGRQQCVVVQ